MRRFFIDSAKSLFYLAGSSIYNKKEGLVTTESDAWEKRREESERKHWKKFQESCFHIAALRVGDRVSILPEPDGWPESDHNKRAGQQGTIVGFAEQAVCRWSEARRSEQKAGFYVYPEYPRVSFPDGAVCQIRGYHLEVVDRVAYAERIRNLEEQYKEFPLSDSRCSPSTYFGDYVGPLPELSIYEGDVVRIKDGAKQPKKLKAGFVLDNENCYTVSWLSFHTQNPNEVGDSKDVPPHFSLADKFCMYSEGSWTEDELELVTRGNLWRVSHGEPLHKRTTLEEKAKFLLDARKDIEFVRHPKDECHWTWLYDAMTQVAEKRGHGIIFKSFWDGMGSASEWYEVVRFTDETDTWFIETIARMTLTSGFLIAREDL